MQPFPSHIDHVNIPVQDRRRIVLCKFLFISPQSHTESWMLDAWGSWIHSEFPFRLILGLRHNYSVKTVTLFNMACKTTYG